MRHNLHSDSGQAGYLALHGSNVVVPLSVAYSLDCESQAANELWTELQNGNFPCEPNPELDHESESFYSGEIGSDASAANQISTSLPLQQLDATQMFRVEQLISRFAKRLRKGFYINGRIESDEEAQVAAVELQRHDDGQCGIIKVRNGDDHVHYTTFGSRATTINKQKSEHSALDLFVHACLKVPGFRQASSVETHAIVPKVTGKQPVAPVAYDGSEPPLKFDSPLLGELEILPSELNNSLILGGTGSGKTASYIEPALMAMLDYRIAGKYAAILVIDPKVELLASIEKKLTLLGEMDRLVVIGQCPPIQFFLDTDDLSLGDRFNIARQFVSVESRGDDGRWAAMADRLIVSLLNDSEAFGNAVGVGLIESMAALVTGDTDFFDRNEWVALRKLLILGMEGPAQISYLADLYDTLCFGIGLTNLDRPFARYAAIKDEDQYFYNARGALLIADLLGGGDIEGLLDMSVRRTASKVQCSNIADLIERGSVIVFQPRAKATHDLVGKALKSLFFRCTMERKDMIRPVALIYDEAQRFISTDEETGEHAFFDRCRAYRVNAFMATQSIAALQAAMGTNLSSNSALESILVNTPTKVCFRTNDPSALLIMKGFIPPDPTGLGHVLHARPPSSLKVGECYFSLGSKWGRHRYQLADAQSADSSVPQSDTHKEEAR